MKKFILKLIKSKRARARALPWVRNILTLALIGANLWAFAPVTTGAQVAAEATTVSGPTDAVSAEIGYAEVDPRALKLARYLKSKNSVLAGYAIDFVAAADKYGLDWKMLPAIAGNESGFAKAYVPGTYNAWGWGGGYLYLGSWGQAIETISKALKENYVAKGATTVPAIGRIYAADPYWAGKVQMYMNQIDKFN